MTTPEPGQGSQQRLGLVILAAGVATVVALLAGSAVVLAGGDDGGGDEQSAAQSDAGGDEGGRNDAGGGGEAGGGDAAGSPGPGRPEPSELADTGRPPSTIEIRPVIEVVPRAKHCGSGRIWCGAGNLGDYRLGPAVLQTPDIVDAQARLSSYGDFVVGITLSDSGATKFETVTRALTKKPSAVDPQLAVVVDDVVISAPAVQGPVPGGEIDISAEFTRAEAERLASAIHP
jgi:hypothetical protein